MLQNRALVVWMQAAVRVFVRAVVSKQFPWQASLAAPDGLT